jgi:HPt (histidine-containing phosphotransfer) domain-containing protein
MSTPPALLGFFRQEAAEYLDQLDQLLAGDEHTPPDAAGFLSHIRALRGSATMTRLGGLPEFAATLERLAAGLRDHDLRWDQRLHFAVRGALAELRALIDRADQWTDADQRLARTQSVALAAVAAAYLGRAVASASPASPVIPISRLFPDDGAPGLVERNPEPPMTIAERFRTDMAAAADSIAREAASLAGGERGTQTLALSDAVRRALLGLGDAAESYGASSIATLAMRMARAPVERPAERIAIQAFAQLLMDRELTDAELASRVREAALTWPGSDAAPGAVAGTPVAGTPEVGTPEVGTPEVGTPEVGTPVASPMPATSVRATAPADPTPSAPISTTLPIVPIESLLYQGPAALARARVVRDALREAWQRVGGTAVDPVAASLLDELSDLLDLAAADPPAA